MISVFGLRLFIVIAASRLSTCE